MTVNNILESSQQGGGFLVDFIVRARYKDLRHCDLSTVLPAGTDNCAKMRSPVNRILQISPL